MLKVEVMYRENRKIVVVYQEWDISPDEIAGEKITKDDIGKFYKYNDGSGWYSPILGVSNLSIRTELGVVRRDDYVHQSIVKYPGTSYSGCHRNEEHDYLRSFSVAEQHCAYRLLHDKPVKYLTKRVKMLTLKKLQEKLHNKQIDEEFIIDLLVNAASKGNEKIKAITILSRIGGVELEPPKQPAGKTPLFLQQNNFTTIQDQRRNMMELPNSKSLKEMIEVSTDKLDEIAKNAEFIKDL